MIYLIYFVIPSIFLAFGAVGKRIVRATHWEWADWFLGVELVLAAMSTGIMHAFDLGIKLSEILKQDNPSIPKEIGSQLITVIIFLVVTIVLFFFVVIAHQEWERVPGTSTPLGQKDWKEKWKLVWLAGICNLIGYALFAAFIFLVKGVA